MKLTIMPILGCVCGRGACIVGGMCGEGACVGGACMPHMPSRQILQNLTYNTYFCLLLAWWQWLLALIPIHLENLIYLIFIRYLILEIFSDFFFYQFRCILETKFRKLWHIMTCSFLANDKILVNKGSLPDNSCFSCFCTQVPVITNELHRPLDFYCLHMQICNNFSQVWVHNFYCITSPYLILPIITTTCSSCLCVGIKL